jgi:hypothetical protein
MHNLFDKALVIADLHYGRSGNSPVANNDNLEFIRWAIDEARTWGAETCIMLGDWHDNRNSLHVSTILASIEGMDLLNAAFKTIWWLPGNHDLLYRDRRDAASIEFAKYLPNIRLIRDPLIVEDVSFIPWLVQQEHKELNVKTRYAFAHLEMPGFYLNSKVEMQESEHTPTAKQFRECGDVFTGHFHMRQSKGNICYTGNIMPSNFSDDGDTDRGAMLLEYGKEPFFKAWPGQPTYKSMRLSEMLSEPDRLLSQNMTVRAIIDLPLRYEEASEIRAALITAYGLRKIELINGQIEGEQQFDDAKIQFRSVDQIVIEGLASVESVELSPSRLIEMYTNL